MKERAIEIKVGVLVLVALGILAGLIVILGDVSLAKGFSFYVDFKFSGNLQAGAPVKVAGIKLGKVKEVRYLAGEHDPKTKRRVYVRAKVWVEDRVRGTIYEDAEFFVNTQGVLGEQYLEIVPGSPKTPAIKPEQILVGVTPPRIDLLISRLYEVLEGVTTLLREDKQTISDLLRTTTRVVKTIDQLLQENQGEIKQLLASLDTFILETGELVKSVRIGVGHPERLRNLLIGVERTALSVSHNIDDLLHKTNAALDVVAKLGATLGPKEQHNIRLMLKQLVKLGDRVYRLTGDAQVVVAKIRKGKGTAGALIIRDELYDDLKEMVRDLKRNPWKFLWRE